MSVTEQRTNASALSQALLLTTVVPWLLNVFVYFLLHRTYEGDAHLVSDDGIVLGSVDSVLSDFDSELGDAEAVIELPELQSKGSAC